MFNLGTKNITEYYFMFKEMYLVLITPTNDQPNKLFQLKKTLLHNLLFYNNI